VINPLTGEIERVAHGWDDTDGDHHLVRCEKNACRVCVIINAQRVAYAIQLAAPTYAIFLSLVGNSAAEINDHASCFAHYIRRDVPEFQWAWAAEANPQLTGNHLHGFVHTLDGDYEIRRPLVRRAAQKAGMGLEVGIKRLEPDLPADWFGYPLKSLVDPFYAPQFIELNRTRRGVQLIHASKQFWRDGASGPQLRRGEAEVISYRRSQSSK
jgi:hypothetical protein